jgi:hypothetical protein
LLDQYEKINSTYEKLDELQLPFDKPVLVGVEWNGVLFEFLVRLKKESSHLLVFGSGGGASQEMPAGPPYFQRHSWMNEFQDSIIYYNDPTLYLGKVSLAWGQGTSDRFYLKDIAFLIEKFMKKVQVNSSNVLFYGSSGGGFMSMFLAGYVKGAKALVNNPQTCLTKWLKTPVRQVFNLSYPNLTEDEVIASYGERINVVKFFRHINYVPKVYYLQNGAFEYDMDNHLLPFLTDLQDMPDDCEINNIKVELYYNPKLKHAAVSKQETIDYVNMAKKI